MHSMTRQACNALTTLIVAAHRKLKVLADAVQQMARKLQSQHRISCPAAVAIARIACYSFGLCTDLDFQPRPAMLEGS